MSAILWQNQDQTITLLDIPRSISAAQGTFSDPSDNILLSSDPPFSPFPSNEPKSVAAKNKLSNNTVYDGIHSQYREWIWHALDLVRANHHGEWCLPRSFTSSSNIEKQRLGKRKLSKDDPPPSKEYGLKKESWKTSSISRDICPDLRCHEMVIRPYLTDASIVCSECNTDICAFKSNCSDTPTFASGTLKKNETSFAPLLFRIPPQASFFLGGCEATQAFHAAIRNQAQTHETRRHFDFILFDPPWPNRSVRRTHKTPRSTYTNSCTLGAVKALVLQTDLDSLIADRGLVGMWITNKPAVRDLVLGNDGIFDMWGLILEEEWIWLKTTTYGEPVTVLDSKWRKPYEVLLLGRKQRSATTSMKEQVDTNLPRPAKHQIIVGVPDLHSRKPCVKELIEPLMRQGKRYRALEVFARHLVSGWWSWGDECLKFNDEGFWRKDTQST